VLVDGGGEQALFLGDVVPTSVHVRLPYIMAFDLDVERTLVSKKTLFARAIEEKWIVLFGHDRQHGGRLARDAKGQAVVVETVTL
jgi:glyoxylase-like metal-dependent hydrolase (beta-lactamase superfamily II)